MMQVLDRYIERDVREDLRERMVFVGGPRQCGKTTFALKLVGASAVDHPAYLNWDRDVHRERILDQQLPAGEPIVVFDEIHKFANWRNLVKGLHDTTPDVSILVTGSARLDYYSKGGDSLQGRYHYYRLHPLTLPELVAEPTGEDARTMLRLGGFPEPLLRGSERFWRRWQLERRRRVIHEDVRDLENVQEITLMELLARELPRRVGSPLSVNALRNSLSVTHATVSRWLSILEHMYYCFRIPPHGGTRFRAVRKQPKLYMWDWSLVQEQGPRFENMVACHLLKLCHYIEDTQGYEMELRYLRDTEGHEVDFVVLRDGRPLFAVECKRTRRGLDASIPYFHQRTDIEKFYQVHLSEHDYIKEGVRVLPITTFCREAGLV